MGLPTLNKFLCCLDLETGGIILGWFSAVFSALGAIALTTLFILALIGFGHSNNRENVDLAAIIVVSLVLGFYVLYLCLVFFASVQLIRGTKARNPSQIKLYLILSGLGCIIAFLQILTAGSAGIAGAIISALISAYFFICIYSLYEMLRNGSSVGTV